MTRDWLVGAAGWLPLVLALLLVLGWYLSYSAAPARPAAPQGRVLARGARRPARAARARRRSSSRPASTRRPGCSSRTPRRPPSEAGEQGVAGPGRRGGRERPHPGARGALDDTAARRRAAPGPDRRPGGPRRCCAQACERVELARRFHNEAVAQAQRVRRKRVVRWARLAGHAAWPVTVEIDDGTPSGLGAGLDAAAARAR